MGGERKRKQNREVGRRMEKTRMKTYVRFRVHAIAQHDIVRRGIGKLIGHLRVFSPKQSTRFRPTEL